MAKYTVKTRIEMADGKVYKRTIKGCDETWVEGIRDNVRANTPTGSTGTVKVIEEK